MRQLRKPKKTKEENEIFLNDQNNSLIDNKSEIEKLKSEIADLKSRVAKRSSNKREIPLSIQSNIDKIIEAIKKESKVNNDEWVTLSTNKLRKVYKINHNRFTETITFAQNNKIFERKEISFSGNVKTFAYKLVQKDIQ